MCDDSRSEKHYWMRRADELRRQMEREDRERQESAARPPSAANARPEPRPAAAPGWRLGSIAAGAAVALSIFLWSTLSMAATFVYVSNNEDGDIGVYTLRADGSLHPGASVPAAGKVVMPMSVSPDKRFLVAAVRSKPFVAQTYSRRLGSTSALQGAETQLLGEAHCRT
jgi:hypothetical protein